MPPHRYGRVLGFALLVVALIAASLLTYGFVFPHRTRLVVSTTTSLYATGLLDYLAEKFNSTHPDVSVEFVAVGSGAALELAKRGDACAVLVHAPSLEQEYISQGVITDHHIFAYNYFIIVGPKSDPANVSGASSAVNAFRRIYLAGEEGKAVFISRGDNSGTNVKELQIWNASGLDPRGKPWYKSIGGGMDQAILVANELNGYTLSDMGTFLLFSKNGRLPNLALLFQNSTELINIYSSYVATSCSGSNLTAAREFVDFVNGAQDLIGSYGIDKYGAPLFYPAKGNEDFLNRTWSELAKG